MAGGLAKCISGCVLAAYNVYFDMRFFEYEMARAGFQLEPPHICLMYLRPLLGLGRRCSLGDACQSHGVPYSGSHTAADDAESSTRLMEVYLDVMAREGIRFFHELSSRGTYKFLRSFDRELLCCSSETGRSDAAMFRSRRRRWVGGEPALAPTSVPQSTAPTRNGIALYWDALKSAVADLQIDDEEIEELRRIVEGYNLQPEQVRMLHGRAFASVISQFISDQWLDDSEVRKLRRLHQCLSKLGWAPGE